MTQLREGNAGENHQRQEASTESHAEGGRGSEAKGKEGRTRWNRKRRRDKVKH